MFGEKKALYGYLLFLVLGPVILVSPAKNDDSNCGNVSVDTCLKKLQTFLRLTSLTFTSQESDLDSLCSNTVAGYNCSVQRVTTEHCLSTEDKALFPIFINMAQYTYLMFCEDGQAYLREALLKNSDCILKQKNALDCCAEQSKLPDLPIMYVLDKSAKSLTERQITACCPVANYIKCVGDVIYKNCGEAANNLTIEYIRRASGEQMESVCQKMPNYPVADPEVCKTPAPVCAGCRLENVVELIALMSLLFVIRVYYIGSI